MEQRKGLADSGHGRYDEIKDEFKVLDTTMYVPASNSTKEDRKYSPVSERNPTVSFISTTRTSNDARSWINT